jgi:hypothetical protein
VEEELNENTEQEGRKWKRIRETLRETRNLSFLHRPRSCTVRKIINLEIKIEKRVTPLA